MIVTSNNIDLYMDGVKITNFGDDSPITQNRKFTGEITMQPIYSTLELQITALNMYMFYLGYLPQGDSPTKGYRSFNFHDCYMSFKNAMYVYNNLDDDFKLVEQVKLQKDCKCPRNIKTQSDLVKLTFAGKLYLGKEISKKFV